MATPSQLIVQQAADNVTAKFTDYLNLKNILDAGTAAATELQRQYDYHISRGDATNANVVKGQLTTQQGKNAAQKIKVDTSKSIYNAALKEYQNLSSSLLTPSEQAAADNALTNSTLNAATAPTTSAADLAAAEKKKKTIKIIIIGGIILVVIITAFFTVRYFVRKNKAAKAAN